MFPVSPFHTHTYVKVMLCLVFFASRVELLTLELFCRFHESVVGICRFLVFLRYFLTPPSVLVDLSSVRGVGF